MNLINLTKITNFFFELGMLKREKHNGFKIEIEKQQPHDWWKGLKQMTYKKFF